MPLFQHDCAQCRFLGTSTGNRVADHYVCGPLLIARLSSEGNDYRCAPISIIREDKAGRGNADWLDLTLDLLLKE